MGNYNSSFNWNVPAIWLVTKFHVTVMQTKLKILAVSGIYTWPYVKKKWSPNCCWRTNCRRLFIHKKLSWNFELWIEEFNLWWFQSLLNTLGFNRTFWYYKREAYSTCCFSVWSCCVSGLSRSVVITLELISLEYTMEGPKQNIDTRNYFLQYHIFPCVLYWITGDLSHAYEHTLWVATEQFFFNSHEFYNLIIEFCLMTMFILLLFEHVILLVHPDG